MAVEGFDQFRFEHDGVGRPVYVRGEGPGVVVMHEVPGITPDVADFTRRVADAGFRSYLPHLFGTPNKPLSNGYAAQQLMRACVSREFHVLASGASSPITEWLRALCRHAHSECGGPGVGALGMCLTGNFALALMVDDAVMAPVLSQPSLPFPLGRERRRGLHLSDRDLAVVRERARRGCGVLGLRFTGDPMVPAERFDRLRSELGDGFEAIEIDSTAGNERGYPRTAHSVLTTELRADDPTDPTRQALDRVLALFEERLRPGTPA